MGRDLDLIRKLGATVWRGSFGWDDHEPQANRFDFVCLHQFVQLAARQGIRLRAVPRYTPAWAASGGRGDGQDWNDPPRHLEDWQRFVQRIARELDRYPNVLSYEV